MTTGSPSDSPRSGQEGMASDTPPRPRSLTEYVVRGVVSGVLLAVVLHAGYVLGTGNFRTVLPGEVYRSGQLSGPALERHIRRHGIRTVVNLRGCCPPAAWYQAEARVTSRLGLAQEDIALSATRLPSTVGARQLLDVIDHAEYPLLFHCHQGADRTGLASVMAVLLRTGATLAEARRHLGLASGHLAVGKTGHIDRFFDLYAAWLGENELTHTSETFRLWVRDHYRGAESHAGLAVLEAVPRSDGRPFLKCRVGQRRMVTVRCHNASSETWRFQPGNNAGVHVWWTLLDRDEKALRTDRAGLYHAAVAPGESIDVAVPLPGLPPGRYELRIDMANEQHGFFSQLGNDLLCVELEVS
jgi:protein tyrosine phosphatase (PTP) superfamily phosphohydrolase (DUF442 family)